MHCPCMFHSTARLACEQELLWWHGLDAVWKQALQGLCFYTFMPGVTKRSKITQLFFISLSQSENSGVNILMQKRQMCESHFFFHFVLLIIPPLLISLSPSVSFLSQSQSTARSWDLATAVNTDMRVLFFSSLLSQMSPQERSVCLKGE